MESGEARARIVSVAEAMIQGDMQLIQGCRTICGLLSDTSESEREAFLAIRGIESETDHFPLGEVRKECSPDYLKRMNAEMERHIEAARRDILDACRELIKIFRR